MVWTITEVFIGIVCACMPSIRVFLQRVLPEWIGLRSQGPDESAARLPAQSHITKTIEYSTNVVPVRERSEFVQLVDLGSGIRTHHTSTAKAWAR